VVPEILHARGVAPERERVRLVVETPEGARREAWLSPVPPGTKPQWREARALAGEAPLAEREPARRHWFRRVAPATVYARYREVYDDPGRTVTAFAEDLFAELRAGDRLVLDLRGNVGGNNYLNQPLLHGVIAAPGLKRPGTLFVLADRGTFSAAMMLLADLEHHAPAILVGEKSGAAPNGYGDSRRVRLPNTGLTVRVSTLYWQMTSPTDHRDGIAPHVAVEPTFAQWREGTDPALDRALALAGTAASPLDGVWEGVVSIRHERYPLRVAVQGSVVTLDAAALAAAGARPRDARIERGELVFSHRGAGPAWEFRARASGSTMLGVARFQGAPVPFVLTKR
jgi:hypothetical protein